MNLGERKNPFTISILRPSLPQIELLSDARTPLGERCVLAHRGWAGENRDFFSVLLVDHSNRRTSVIQGGPVGSIDGRVAIVEYRTVLVEPRLQREIDSDRFGF